MLIVFQSDIQKILASDISISGTCQKFDQSTNCANSQTVRVAVNGTLSAQTALTSGGSFSISNVSVLSGDIVTVFVDGVADGLEAVAVAKYDGVDGITGIKLYEEHLTLGSADNQTITNADLSQYDNSAADVSVKENIFFDVDGNNDLDTDATNQSNQEELYIVTGNTYRPDAASSGNVTTTNLENVGTITADGNTIVITGSWTKTGTFNYDTSTVRYTSQTNSVVTAADYYHLEVKGQTLTDYGVDLAGGSTRVAADTNAALNIASNITLETWIQLDANNYNNGLIYKGNLAGNQGEYSFGFYTGNSNKLTVRLNGSITEDNGQATSNVALSTGQLYHIAFTYDGVSIRIWINGSLDRTSPYASPISNTNLGLTIGNYYNGGYGFNGKIFSTRISNLVRYDAAFSPARTWVNDAGTAMLWNYSENTGASVGDSSSNGITGTLAGTYSWTNVTSDPTQILASGNFNIAGNLIAGDGASTSTVNIDTNDPTLNIYGNFTNSANNTFVASASGTFSIAGNYANAGAFTDSAGTVTFDKASGTQTITTGGIESTQDFQNITKSTGGTLQVVTNPLKINGSLTVNSSTTVDINGQNLTLVTLANSGTLQLQGGETVSIANMDLDSGMAEYVGSGTYTSLALGNAYSNIKINGSGTWTLGADLAIFGNFTMQSGTFNASNRNIAFFGTGDVYTTNGGAFNADTSTIKYMGAGAANIGDIPYYNLEFQPTNPYKRTISVTNSSGGTLTDIQTKILLTSSNFDFSHSTTDGRDIRIYASDGTTPLDFYIESWNQGASTATVWVKIPSLTVSGTTLYIYYGNGSLPSLSSGSNTFILFDDFNDLSAWTQTGTSISVSDGVVTLDNTGGTAPDIRRNFDIASPYTVETKYQRPSNYRNRMYLTTPTGINSPTGYDYGDFDTLYWGGWSETTLANNTWYTVRWDNTASDYIWTINNNATGAQVFTRSHGSAIANLGRLQFYGSESASSDLKFDWVRIRKYASTEPSASVGEESASTGTATFTLPASATLSVGNDMTVAAGTATTLNGTIDVNGTFTQSGGVFVAPSGTMTVAKNFVHSSGTFTHSSGTIELDGTATATVVGDTTFNNFKVDKSGGGAKTVNFTAASTQTIVGTLTLKGNSTNRLVLNTTSAPTKWKIDPQGTRAVDYVDVSYSDNINASAIAATNSNNYGNNVNWTFAFTVTLSANAGTVAENGGTSTVTATLVGGTTVDTVTVNLSISGTAIKNTDYTISTESISIAGGTTTGTSTVTSSNDTDDDEAETVIIDISSVSNAAEDGTQQVTITIIDDDVAFTGSANYNEPLSVFGMAGGVSNSATYRVFHNLGEGVIGQGSSANYNINAGFHQDDQPNYLACGVSPTSVDLGALRTDTVSSQDVSYTVVTNAVRGYSVKAYDNTPQGLANGLIDGSAKIADATTPDGFADLPGASAEHFGITVTGSRAAAGYANGTKINSLDSTSFAAIGSNTTFTQNDSVTIQYRASISPTSPAARNYQALTTLICTGNF